MKPTAHASAMRAVHRPLRRAMRSTAPMLLAGVLAGCATAPESSTTHANCGGLPPPFSAPFACPVTAQPAQVQPASARSQQTLSVEQEAAGCFTPQREPGAEGGLRISRQIVCPTVRPVR
jgi:hypothetical protein